jgi:hypothetical protein
MDAVCRDNPQHYHEICYQNVFNIRETAVYINDFQLLLHLSSIILASGE